MLWTSCIIRQWIDFHEYQTASDTKDLLLQVPSLAKQPSKSAQRVDGDVEEPNIDSI